MEKVLLPFFLFGKKRYASVVFTGPDSKGKMDSKGLQLVRRDSVPFVREVSKDILHLLMHERNVKGAYLRAREAANALVDGKIPMEKLVLSKSLKKDYKNDCQPHVAVARKLEGRNPGSGPKPGERVQYVFVVNKKARTQTERAEDPAYVTQNRISLDYSYYLEHQYINPVFSLLELTVENGGKDPKKKIFGDIVNRARNSLNGQRGIAAFLTKMKASAV